MADTVIPATVVARSASAIIVVAIVIAQNAKSPSN
jgi:hypothetical protein